MEGLRKPIGAGDKQRPSVILPLYGRPSSWIILLSVTLVAVRVFGRQQPRPMTTIGNVASDEPKRRSQSPASAIVSRQGWQDVLGRLYHGISEDRILLVAAGVTFYAILALFPGIGVIVSIYGLFADPSR